MASILPLTSLLLLLHLSSSLSPLPCSDLVRTTCNATAYYDFCISSLASSPQTPSATTVKSLSTVVVNLAIANATNTSSFASALSKAAASPPLAALYRTCAEKYVHARESLQSSLDEISNEMYDYAFVHVSAAAEYPNVCRVLFRRGAAGPAAVYPAEMAKREEALQRLCTVALDIISLLG